MYIKKGRAMNEEQARRNKMKNEMLQKERLYRASLFGVCCLLSLLRLPFVHSPSHLFVQSPYHLYLLAVDSLLSFSSIGALLFHSILRLLSSLLFKQTREFNLYTQRHYHHVDLIQRIQPRDCLILSVQHRG